MFKKEKYSLANELAEIIIEVARREDNALSELANEGIFHMPELAFAYECGKAIMAQQSMLFAGNTPKWVREKNLGNGGPTDLLFEFSDGKRIAIEFKLRDTSNKYIKDIKKLSRLNDDVTLRIFCALVDVFESELPDDGRQKAVESFEDESVEVIQKESFPTKQSWYQSQVHCVAALWTVGNIPCIKT